MDDNFLQELSKNRIHVNDEYDYKGCKIGRGTYGRVYMATSKLESTLKFALKQVDVPNFSFSSCREISILRELNHPNVIGLLQLYIDHDLKQMWMLFDYAEYDLWSILRYHRCETARPLISAQMSKSILFQILKGIAYIHSKWVIHRDIKPANILVMGDGKERGCVKIADMGFSRIFQDPLKEFTAIDPVVVTHWYRSFELLLGERSYTTAIDMWSIACVYCEILTLDPLFISRQEDIKTSTPYHKDQIYRIISVLGYPIESSWPAIKLLPEYARFKLDFKISDFSDNLNSYLERHKINTPSNKRILSNLLAYDPVKRSSAKEALQDPYFTELPLPSNDVFEGLTILYHGREFMKSENTPETKK